LIGEEAIVDAEGVGRERLERGIEGTEAQAESGAGIMGVLKGDMNRAIGRVIVSTAVAFQGEGRRAVGVTVLEESGPSPGLFPFVFLIQAAVVGDPVFRGQAEVEIDQGIGESQR
jgi:hypothetical protein